MKTFSNFIAEQDENFLKEFKTWNSAMKDYENKESQKMKDFRVAKAKNEKDKANKKVKK